jgi:NAD(P)-dependent dehydrogenase (short-subunit alcohol dehydrogenase family)
MTAKVAIVTGASSGIGAATAKLLGSQGYAVAVHYNNNAQGADKTVDSILTQGGQAIAVKADLHFENEIKNLFEIIDTKLGSVTALVNNAGHNGGIAAVESITSERLQSVFSINVFATFICCREAIKRMKQTSYGSIVNVSSEAAKFGGNQLAHYAAAKAAINTFTIGFAREVAAYKVRINAISPGVIDTGVHPQERLQKLQDSIPMGRMGTAEEVAASIAWLLSDEASYVSGSIMSVAGAR